MEQTIFNVFRGCSVGLIVLSSADGCPAASRGSFKGRNSSVLDLHFSDLYLDQRFLQSTVVERILKRFRPIFKQCHIRIITVVCRKTCRKRL